MSQLAAKWIVCGGADLIVLFMFFIGSMITSAFFKLIKIRPIGLAIVGFIWFIIGVSENAWNWLMFTIVIAITVYMFLKQRSIKNIANSSGKTLKKSLTTILI